MTEIGLLHGGASYHLNTLADVSGHPIYLPDLARDTGPLDELDTLVVFDRLHPGLLRRHADALLTIPRRGGTLVVLGEVEAHTWIPGLRWSPRPTNFWWWRTGEDPGIRLHRPDHPIWRHLGPDDVRWHFHGVLHPAPTATALVTADGSDGPAGVLLYEDVFSEDVFSEGVFSEGVLDDDTAGTPGSIVVTTMDPVHHHGSNFMPAASRLLHGLLRWLSDEPVPR